MPFPITTLNHEDRAIADAIHAVLISAYSQEAALLGARDFPPLKPTVKEIRSSPTRFMGAQIDGAIVGVVEIEVNKSPETVRISSLVVAPEHQRRGIGTSLAEAALASYPGAAVKVSTGARNAPALELYAKLGFTVCEHRSVGSEAVEIVCLFRPSSAKLTQDL